MSLILRREGERFVEPELLSIRAGDHLRLFSGSQVEIEQRAEGDENLRVSGYASTSDPDSDDWVISPDGWREGMEVYMRQNPMVLFNHDRDQIIGRTTAWSIDSKGLRLSMELDMKDPDAARRAGQIQRGFLRAMSVGFLVKEAPKWVDGKLYFAKQALMENSVVSVPANVFAGIDQIGRSESANSAALAVKDVLDRAMSELRDSLRRDVTSDISAQVVQQALKDLREEIGFMAAEALFLRVGSVRELLVESAKAARAGDEAKLKQALDEMRAEIVGAAR